tara:strand:- start:511 stop:1254 length:744 start_codon:yes stop_codon:yes gene_type:complete
MHEANPKDILFDEARIKKLKEIKEPPQVIHNFFNEDEIAFLIEKQKSFETVNKQGAVNNWRYSNQPEFVEWLENKFKTVLTRDFEMHGGNFFRTNIPFFVHTDTAKDHDFVPYKNVVVPLMIQKEDQPCYTVMFKQRWYGEATMFWKGPMFLSGKPDYNHKLVDYSELEGYTNRDIGVDEYTRFLTHLPYNNLHGLSTEMVLEWKLGSIIIFDCTQLHSSNDFTSKGSSNPKYALSYFCKLKEDNGQ